MNSGARVNPKAFFESLQALGVDYFLGVPDSLLKDFCGYVTDHVPESKHIITVNEGQAIAVGCGYHLATKKVCLVYLQNSGLGNIINPLMSLAHEKVYGFPMLILVGWRGEPGVKDEPQHMIMGECMESMISSTNCKSIILQRDNFEKNLQDAYTIASRNNAPVFLIARKDFFSPYKLTSQSTNSYSLNREQALEIILKQIPHGLFFGTTGFLSRELCELRDKLGQKSDSDFLCVGSMGYASSLALGTALNAPDKQVYVLDGDGAMLMHLGCLSIIGAKKPKNLVHILLNNECHDSVGQQPTCANSIDFGQIAMANGYVDASVAESDESIVSNLSKILTHQSTRTGPVFLEIKIKPGARSDLGRPKQSTFTNKAAFMNTFQTISES